MVRTRANNAAVRKAVVAKAPRKNLGGARGGVASPTSSSGKRKGKTGGSGNPLKIWPAPAWQKGIHTFFGGGEQNSAECSSSSSSGNTSQTEIELGEQDITGGPSSSSAMCEAQGSSSVKLLDDDLTQLNSDSDED